MKLASRNPQALLMKSGSALRQTMDRLVSAKQSDESPPAVQALQRELRMLAWLWVRITCAWGERAPA